jgi:transcriptional regulator with XRE-family HTH domain
MLDPPEVPAEFWDSPQFGPAFDARHLGSVLRAYRHHPWHGAKVSQARLAGWLQTTQAQISRAENGPPPQDLKILTWWARVLGIPARHLWFALPTDVTGRSTPAGVSPVRSVDVAAMLAAAQAFRMADRRSGGRHLYRTVRHYLQVEVGPQLVALGAGPDAAAAFDAAACMTEMIGWMAHDSGCDVLAAEHLAAALRLAVASGDLGLQACVLASMSHLADSLGRKGEAIECAQAGLRLLARGDHGMVLGRLHAMEARGHAGVGDAAACRRALENAERALGGPPGGDVSKWASPFDEASLAGEAATCMRGLGQLGEALRQADRVVELRGVDRARSRALGQLALANIHLQQGQVDAAAAFGSSALSGARAVSSARVHGQLVDLGRSLLPHRRVRAASEFLASLGDAS